MRAQLVEREIDPAALLAEVSAASNGAAVLFVGTVREVNEGRQVSGIDYAAYSVMAQAQLEGIAREAAERLGSDHVVVEHRIGSLGVGETSVAIAAAHAHRARAFDAARFVIEEIKRRVPIWKREHYVDGTLEWVDPTRPGAESSR